MNRKPKTLSALAKAFEENAFFNEEVGRLSEKQRLNTADLQKLKDGLHKLGFPRLTSQWDDFLILKISNPQLSLSKIMAGGAIFEEKIDESGKDYFDIRVYPNETTLEDVKRTYGVIVGRYKKSSYREIDYFELGKYIAKLTSEDNLTHQQVAERLRDEGKYAGCTYSDVARILHRYRKAIKK